MRKADSTPSPSWPHPRVLRILELSQFMDQTNPLSETRTSGVSRTWTRLSVSARFEVRDVHPTTTAASAHRTPEVRTCSSLAQLLRAHQQ